MHWLKLGSKLFLAMSQIHGLARLIVAQLGLCAIFSCTTATLFMSSQRFTLITLEHGDLFLW